MTPGRNDPDHCARGKKYKECHLDIDRDALRALVEGLPMRGRRLAAHAPSFTLDVYVGRERTPIDADALRLDAITAAV